MPALLIVIGLYLLGHTTIAAWVALLGGAVGVVLLFIAAFVKALAEMGK